jgi:hypothetical protein
MFDHFIEVVFHFPKWFLYGLCPAAYLMVGILISHLFNWQKAKNARIGCGDFSAANASNGGGWGCPAHCPADKLCSTHDSRDTTYTLLMFFSVFAWPGTIALSITCIVIFHVVKGIWKGFGWLWGIPERSLKRKWAKLDRLVELLREKYPFAPIEVKEAKNRSDLMIFHVTYQEKMVVGGYRSGRGFKVHATLNTENLDVFREEHKDHIPEVQGAYCRIVELLGKPR